MATEDAGRAARLGTGRLQLAFALLSVVLLGVLAIAPTRTYFSEWRATQQRYNVLARRAKGDPIEVHVRQVSPALDIVDRCGSCHLGAAGAAPVAGDPLFAAHPPVAHDPTRFGCTICHGGQGRALTARAAHGDEPNWEEPLLRRPYREAGCGVCHSHVAAPNPEHAASGQALFDARGCGICHSVDGRNTATKRDLSQVGLRGYPRDWQDRHLRAAASSDGGAGCPLPLKEQERVAIEAYLGSLIGAPQLMAGKLLAARLGCRGCHRIAGVGGDGPDLSDIGDRRVSDLDFSQVRGEHTLVGWLTELLADPSRLSPDSRMPAPGLDSAQIDELVTYLLSLRTRPIPVTLWPRDRARGMLLGERDFAVDGHSLFLAFCSACHGRAGEGRLAANAPAIGGAAFLAIASDDVLRGTLREGRPEHGMPPWGSSEGGLRPEEITAIIGYLRSLQPVPPAFEEVSASELDLPRGRAVFQVACAPCHGEHGEGTAIGAPLAAKDNPVTSRSSAIYGTLANGIENTAMGAFSTFDAPTLRALIGAVETLDRTDGARRDWHPRRGDPGRGHALFASQCATCHRARPEGRVAPAIEDPRFLAMAPDSFLTASIVRRHDRNRDGLRRSPEEVSDLVAYLRGLDRRPDSGGAKD